MSKALWLVLLALALGALLWARAQTRVETLVTGEPAPDFSLPDARGAPRALADFRGEWLLLYFYPKNDTPGCTKQACTFRDGYQELRARGVQVVGVSLDDGASHQAFAAKYRLPFPLLSDHDGAVAERYRALWSIGPVRFAKRHSFLIDPQGRLARIYRKVEVDTHYRQVLDDLNEVQIPQTD
jgi:thioredoxin-dependent peroxiredoxin